MQEWCFQTKLELFAHTFNLFLSLRFHFVTTINVQFWKKSDLNGSYSERYFAFSYIKAMWHFWGCSILHSSRGTFGQTASNHRSCSCGIKRHIPSELHKHFLFSRWELGRSLRAWGREKILSRDINRVTNVSSHSLLTEAVDSLLHRFP